MSTINLQIQIFLLMAIGYFLGKKKMMSEKTEKEMTDIVIQVIVPCSIISSFQTELTADLLSQTVLVLLLAFGISVLYAVVNLFLYRWMPEDERIACKYGTMVTNASFVGLPVVQAILGAEGLLYASFFVIPQRIFMWAYGLPMYVRVEKKQIFRKVASHPCLVSIYIGIAVMALQTCGITLPEALSDTIGAIGRCTNALCMMIIGCIVSKMKLRDMVSGRAIFYTVCRLLLLPAIVTLLLTFVPVSVTARLVCVLMSAMPAPTTVVMLAKQYNRAPEFASKLILTSTLGSLITIPVIFRFAQLLIR